MYKVPISLIFATLSKFVYTEMRRSKLVTMHVPIFPQVVYIGQWDKLQKH